MSTTPEEDVGLPARIRALPAFDGPFAARRLAADGCDVLWATYPAGTEIAEHCHETDNVGVITRGELILIIGGEETTFGPGDWYVVPRGCRHAARFEVATTEIELWFTDG